MQLTLDPRRLLDRLRSASGRPADPEPSPMPIVRKMGFDFAGSATRPRF